MDIDKLLPVPVDLGKLSNFVKNEIVKKIEYNGKIKSIEDKIPDITNLATKTSLNTKINEVKNNIPNMTGLYGGREGSFTIFISQINKWFSNRQLFFKLGNIFHIHNYFLNK